MRMATEGNGGLGSSEEVPEGLQMGSPVESFDALLADFIRQSPRLVREEYGHFPAMVGGSGSLQSNRMVTEGNEGLVSSEEVREGQQIRPPLESVAAFPLEDSTRNTLPWLESYSRKLVLEAFQHLVISGPESVAAFLMEDSTQNTLPWVELVKSDIRGLVREAFEHFVISGSESIPAFLMEDSTQKTTTWLASYSRKLVREAFQHFVIAGPESSVSRREQIQEPDRIILQLQLHFETSMPDHVFVGKKVKGRDGAICVKLIDATTGYVESGPLSSLTLDVVVLAGDFENNDDGWTWEYFKSKVEMGREGKGPLLEGDLQVPLKAGVGSLAELKFTDISTCSRSGKFRLGVKVEQGFFMGIRVREAITVAFKVKHYKKKSEEKHVPRALDDDVCTLKGIRKEGPFHKNLNAVGIFKVEDFLWKLCLDPEGLRKILGKTVSDKTWKTLGDHAKESVPSGKYHVYYADNMKNSGIVFKNMSEVCGLIEDGKYYSAETLTDSQKESAGTLKKVAGDKWKDIAECDGPLPLEMNPCKRARSSQTDVVTAASESCPSGSDQPVSQAFPTVPSGGASEKSVLDYEDRASFSSLDVIPGKLPSPSPNPSEKADGNTEVFVGTHGGSFEQGKQLGGSNSPRIEKGMCYQGGGIYSQRGGGYLPMKKSLTWSEGNVIWDIGNTSSLRGNAYMDVLCNSGVRGNVNIPSSNYIMGCNSPVRGNVNIPSSNYNIMGCNSPVQGNVNFPSSNCNMGCNSGVNMVVGNTCSLGGNVKGGASLREMAYLDSKFEKLSFKGPVG